MNMHELKVTTSTVHKDQSTVIMSFKHLHTRTRRERAKRAHSLYIIKISFENVWDWRMRIEEQLVHL